MKIGIISDTHDNVGNILKAVKVFQAKGVEFVVHCGDVVSPASAKFFNGVKIKLVKGNCDGDTEHIGEKLESIAGEYLGESAELSIDGKQIAAYHGQDKAKLDKIIKSGQYRYVLTGHSHKLRDEVVGKTRVLNPGAHYYGSEGTIMILDLKEDKVEVIRL